jgi:hypothetical protein
MATTSARRRFARFPIPSQLSGPWREDQLVRVVELSAEGTRIEHLRPVPDWDLCIVDLPPALGGARLQGRVVWSRVAGRKPVAGGKWLVYYQSGLALTLLTPEQKDAVAAALEILKAAQGE